MKNETLDIHEMPPLPAQIAEWLEARNIFHERLPCGKIETAEEDGNQKALCQTYLPERFCIIRGQIIFIEIKHSGGGEKLSPAKSEKHLELMRSGAIVIVADSLDQFTAEFNAYRAAIETREKQLMRLMS